LKKADCEADFIFIGGFLFAYRGEGDSDSETLPRVGQMHNYKYAT
jgi:hypothetical protein